MEFYIDSADIKVLAQYTGLSMIKGITTTPTFFYKLGIHDYKNEVKKISALITGYTHVEAMGQKCDEIVENAKMNASLGERIISKIPMGIEGVKAVIKLKQINIKTNVHLIFSLSQAVLAAEAGADYICPLIGRLHDIDGNGIELIENIVKVFKQYKYPARIMASSIRSQEDVTNSLLCGVDAITIPPPIMETMFSHPLTSIGERLFKKDLLLSGSVFNIMRTGKDVPRLNENSSLLEAFSIMTEKKIGLCIVVDSNNKVKGIITDGDIRRSLMQSPGNISACAAKIMNTNPILVDSNMPVSKALELMEDKLITTLVVADKSQAPIGYVNLHDILNVIKHHGYAEKY